MAISGAARQVRGLLRHTPQNAPSFGPCDRTCIASDPELRLASTKFPTDEASRSRRKPISTTGRIIMHKGARQGIAGARNSETAACCFVLTVSAVWEFRGRVPSFGSREWLTCAHFRFHSRSSESSLVCLATPSGIRSAASLRDCVDLLRQACVARAGRVPGPLCSGSTSAGVSRRGLLRRSCKRSCTVHSPPTPPSFWVEGAHPALHSACQSSQGRVPRGA